jgi:site-specific recombinase
LAYVLVVLKVAYLVESMAELLDFLKALMTVWMKDQKMAEMKEYEKVWMKVD